jgi:exosortase
MPLTDHPSLAPPLHDKSLTDIVGEASESLERGPFQALSWPLPVSIRTRNGLSLFLLLVTIAWFWQPLAVLYSLTQEQPYSHYSHIPLIPWVSVYAFYLNRKAILASWEWSPLPGLLLVGLGAIGYWLADPVAYGADHLSLTILALVVASWGIFLFCYGLRTCRTFSFGLLFLLCMVPLPAGPLHTIIVFLQQSSAEVTDFGFSLLGVPVIRDGFVFVLSNVTIEVAEGCSGIRSTLSLIITSIVAGHFFLRSVWGKLGIVAVVVPLAIIKNGVRIVVISLLANYVDTSSITDGIPHDSIGLPLFGLSVVILISLVWLLRRFEQRHGYYPPDGLHAKL